MTQSWLNYHHLYYFKVIATEGSIAKASKTLRLGQPTLSAQLKILEDVIGHRLFDRQNRKLVLTDAGRVALDYANEIFRLGTEMLDSINQRPIQGRLDFHVGVIDTIPKHVSMEVLNAARTVADCVVTVHEGKGSELLRDLRDHRLDLVLLNSAPPISDASTLHSRKVARMPVMVCGSRKFIALRKNFPASISGQPFIVPTPDSQLRHSLDHWLAIQDQKINIVAEAQDTSLQKLLATKDLGLIVAAQSAVEALIQDKDLVWIGTLQGVFEEYWVVAVDKKIPHPITQKLMRTLELKSQDITPVLP
jgi:LysR family transcriptional activator of nhaA